MRLELLAPDSAGPRTLLVIASNPPTTSGVRTLARAEQARQILDFDHIEISNLFSLPTHQTKDVSTAGSSAAGWLTARENLTRALDNASAVLLAYGVGKPTGPAAKHHAEQVAWLEEGISVRDLTVWWVGGAPRHPSRWQRYTFRAHPELLYPQALKTALTTREMTAEAVLPH